MSALTPATRRVLQYISDSTIPSPDPVWIDTWLLQLGAEDYNSDEARANVAGIVLALEPKEDPNFTRIRPTDLKATALALVRLDIRPQQRATGFPYAEDWKEAGAATIRANEALRADATPPVSPDPGNARPPPRWPFSNASCCTGYEQSPKVATG